MSTIKWKNKKVTGNIACDLVELPMTAMQKARVKQAMDNVIAACFDPEGETEDAVVEEMTEYFLRVLRNINEPCDCGCCAECNR